jgi:riboflavin kinase/FMN adenylyltransferase
VIAAIGAFDGFHLGHQALLERAAIKAGEADSGWGVITFANHPDRFFAGFSEPSYQFEIKGLKGEALKSVWTIAQPHHKQPIDRELVSAGKENAIGSSWRFKSLFVLSEQMFLERFFSVPVVHRIDFTQKIAEMSPEEFLGFIGSEFGVDGVVVGEDFRFGKNRSGNPAGLCESCARRGWSADVIPMRLSSSGEPICSTAIRKAVISGGMKLAWELMGYPFFLRSSVVHGFNRGTKLGFPTANVEIDPLKIEMRHGVYATLAYIDGAWRAGAVNVGLNPTFGDISLPRFEVNLLDYEGDLYGREITVFMLSHIRDEIRFGSPEDLTAQVARDTEAIQQLSAEAFSEHSGLWKKLAGTLKGA